MLFLNFSNEVADPFQSKYREVAEQFKGEGISFLIGDLDASQGAFQVSMFWSYNWFWFFTQYVPLIW